MFFFSSRRRHTRYWRDWSSDVCSSDLKVLVSDPERSAKFYEALGFKRTQAAPPFIHLQWEKQAEVYLVTLPPMVKLEGQRGLGVLLGFRIGAVELEEVASDRKSTRLNSSHANISYAVFCLKKKK